MDGAIQKIVDTINSDFEIMSIPYRYEHNAQFGSCYDNVAEKVKRSGGNIQYGWFLGGNDFIYEAIHHAVWENPQEELFDITPQHKIVSTVLFIPDDRFVFDGTPIDNVRVNLTGKLLVDDFIVVSHLIERIKSNGKRTKKTTRTLDESMGLLYEKYFKFGQVIAQFLMREVKEDAACVCGGSLPYEQCHHVEVWDHIRRDIDMIPDKLIHLQNYFSK